MIALLVMAVLIQRFKLDQLLVLASMLLGTLMYFRVQTFVSMMWRMRWLFLSMTMIYAYTTPGEYLPHWPMDMAPTYEGLTGAAYQIARMLMVLAGIAVLMATSTREALMAGIYFLIKPLRHMGLSPERFTARLCLTLQYIDERGKTPSKLEPSSTKWTQILTLKTASAQQQSMNETISLYLPRFSLLDYFSIFIIFLVIVITL